MEKEDDIVDNTAPTLAGVAAVSANKDVEDDLDNNLTANKNIEDNDVVGASPPSTTPTKNQEIFRTVSGGLKLAHQHYLHSKIKQ